MRVSLLTALAPLALIAMPIAHATRPIPSPSPSPSPIALDPRTQADQAFAQRNIPEKALEALQIYRGQFKANPKDAENGWRLAFACYFVGLRMTQGEKAKAELHSEGRDAGLAAVKANKDCAPCHFWTAINIALYGQSVGVFKTITSLKIVRQHLRETLRLDPRYAYAGAYRLEGVIEQKLPGLLGGSDDKARENFEKALEIAPDEPLNYLFLARLLKTKFDDTPGAMNIARKGLAVQVTEPERIEAREALKDLQNFIDRNGNEEEKGK